MRGPNGFASHSETRDGLARASDGSSVVAVLFANRRGVSREHAHRPLAGEPPQRRVSRDRLDIVDCNRSNRANHKRKGTPLGVPIIPLPSNVSMLLLILGWDILDSDRRAGSDRAGRIRPGRAYRRAVEAPPLLASTRLWYPSRPELKPVGLMRARCPVRGVQQGSHRASRGMESRSRELGIPSAEGLARVPDLPNFLFREESPGSAACRPSHSSCRVFEPDALGWCPHPCRRSVPAGPGVRADPCRARLQLVRLSRFFGVVLPPASRVGRLRDAWS